AKAGHAMFAMAIVPIKVVGDETIHPARDTATDPGFQHLAPTRIVQTCPILAHPTDAVGLVGDGLSELVFFQQLKRIRDRLWSEQLFIPLVTIEAEEAARPLSAS